MVRKSILVTVFKKDGHNDETVYGDYNAVTRKRNGWSVKSQKIYMCYMSEEDYYTHSTERREI